MIARYKFVPSAWAKEMFNLKASEYVGSGISPLLEEVLGDFEKLVPAQDPLCGGKASGEITIQGGKSIGTILKLCHE